VSFQNPELFPHRTLSVSPYSDIAFVSPLASSAGASHSEEQYQVVKLYFD